MEIQSGNRREALGMQRASIVLLHGYGADEHDLFTLADLFPPEYAVVCPRAPLPTPWGGYAWFDLDLQNGEFRYDEKQAQVSANLLVELLRGLETPVVVGGFSQGAMIAFGAAVTSSLSNVAGMICMSGAWLPCFQSMSEPAFPFLLSHGTGDQIVPFEWGRDACQKLQDLGAKAEFDPFAMGHEINPECLDLVVLRARDWVEKWHEGIQLV
jgi:phospholipase/carboxylesterase